MRAAAAAALVLAGALLAGCAGLDSRWELALHMRYATPTPDAAEGARVLPLAR
jgi:hypothetical protein